MIEVVNLVKKFKTSGAAKVAVDNVTFSIGRNKIFGILGTNGAGKTTLIRLLTMQTSPTAGKIFYDGKPLEGNETAVKRLIGVVPQHINFDQDLNVAENLELHARLYRLEKSERKAKIAELLEYMELSEFANYNVRKLSGGMKRRLLIARALIHNPKIIFLDEPTVALDPQVRRKIWSLIENLRDGGATIILTTHYIEEAEKLCQQVAILNKGRLIATGNPKVLCERLGGVTVVLQGKDGKIYQRLQKDAETAEFAANEDTVVNVRPTNLEDVFVELTKARSE